MKKNWPTRIADARKRGWFTVAEDDLADKWDRAVCWEDEEGPIKDDFVLITCPLGAKFWNSVYFNDFDGAEEALEQIEEFLASEKPTETPLDIQ